MSEFARKNAGPAIAVAAYAALGAGGVLAVQHVASPALRPPIAAPPATGPAGTPAPTPSGTTPSTRSRQPSSSPGPTVIAGGAPQGSRSAGSTGSGGVGGSSDGGGGRMHPTGKPSGPTPTPTSPTCSGGRVAAVSLPLGVLPCDTVRVGRAVTIGGTK